MGAVTQNGLKLCHTSYVICPAPTNNILVTYCALQVLYCIVLCIVLSYCNFYFVVCIIQLLYVYYIQVLVCLWNILCCVTVQTLWYASTAGVCNVDASHERCLKQWTVAVAYPPHCPFVVKFYCYSSVDVMNVGLFAHAHFSPSVLNICKHTYMWCSIELELCYKNTVQTVKF